jgi:hypothetical protein
MGDPESEQAKWLHHFKKTFGNTFSLDNEFDKM